MKVSVAPGKYILAVSGGVDSMVLLDMLARMSGLELIVAHFEHGIRKDSDIDRQLVEDTARRHGLPFVFERGNLGSGASEAVAREARYAFLHRVKGARGAQAIITAHHQDDIAETAILNMLRGTGRKGLSSLRSAGDIVRPFLHVTKRNIYDYAGAHPEIIWRDDITNDSDQYLRNYVRHHFLHEASKTDREQLLGYIQKANEVNPVIDGLLQQDITEHSAEGGLNRRWFTMLPYDISCEVIAAWLRQRGIREFDRKTIERLVVGAKVAVPGKRLDINAGYLLEVTKPTLKITPRTAS